MTNDRQRRSHSKRFKYTRTQRSVKKRLNGSSNRVRLPLAQPRDHTPETRFKGFCTLCRIPLFWREFIQSHSKEVIPYKRLLFGQPKTASPSFFLTRWIFLRFLGIIYFIAFISLWVQIDGLIGNSGILPAKLYLDAVWDKLGIVGYWTFPTLCWISADISFIYFLCGGGAFLSLLLVLGILPIPSLVGLWLAYLSLSTVCRTFLGYQWDILLLEVGFLAIFFAPEKLWPNLSKEKRPSKLVVWLHHWLLFRLMFSSGIVKLNSGDFTWRKLNALDYHYETQPIPNIVAWYVHQLPEWSHSLSVLSVLAIELILPFFTLAPRRLRFLAFIGTVFLQILILTTGNYGFFNLLTIALSIVLLDDDYLIRILPKRIFVRPFSPEGRSITGLVASIIAATIIIPLSIIQMKARVFHLDLSEFEKRLYAWTAPYRTVNSYGLFANMTKSRPEIIIEGSHDGKNWKPYEFKWKPGNLKRRPAQAAPHQPRIDWQMWFEGLNYLRGQQPTVWFNSFLSCLLKGEREVLNLLESNPFQDSPPHFIRAIVYNYHFTNFETRKRKGWWWKRDYLGIYVYPSGLYKKKINGSLNS